MTGGVGFDPGDLDDVDNDVDVVDTPRRVRVAFAIGVLVGAAGATGIAVVLTGALFGP
jgi:signal recognition particle receptor subunit beta